MPTSFLRDGLMLDVNRAPHPGPDVEQLLSTSSLNSASRPAGWWRPLDTCCLVAGIFCLLTVPTYCSAHRIFWEDEMLGWMLLRDPSLRHMFTSWMHGADGGGIAFYLTARYWLDLFGASVRSFRMYSQFCFALAFSINWITMRRFYGRAVVAFSSLFVWLSSAALVQHMAEGRFYGLLMASVAAAIWMAVPSSARTKPGCSFYAAVFLIHALVVTSHILGIVFSFFVVASMLWLDRTHGRWRPLLYVSAIVPWLLLIPCLPAMRASAHVGKPHFWTSQPRAVEFVMNYLGFSPTSAAPILLLLAFVVVLLLWNKRSSSTLREAYAERKPIYVIAFSMFLIPILFYIEGIFGTPLAVSRYLLPMALATSYLLAEAVTLALPLLPRRIRHSRLALAAGWMFFLGILALYDYGYRPRHSTLQRDYTARLTQSLPAGIPVVCEDAFTFTELMSRQHNSPVQYTFLLDWAYSVSQQALQIEVTQYHLMQNWKDVGYFSDSIQYADSFFRDHPHFYTISMNDYAYPMFRGAPRKIERGVSIGNLLHTRLAGRPAYKVSLFKEVQLGELSASVWQVCRVDVASQCE